MQNNQEQQFNQIPQQDPNQFLFQQQQQQQQQQQSIPQQQQFFSYQPQQIPQNQNYFIPHPQQIQISPNYEFRPKPRKRRTGITRRRTVTACEYCRLKKIKCDLEKPTCGSCKKSGNGCVYRANQKPHEDNISGLTDLNKKARPPKWSSCNWYSKIEGVLEWPIFESRFKTDRSKDINTLLSEYNSFDLPILQPFSPEDLKFLNEDIKFNLNKYVDDYCNNIQTKNPYINSKDLYLTVEFIEDLIKRDPGVYLFNGDINFPEELVPISMIVLLCANSLLSRPFGLKNLELFKSSKEEKSENYELSFKLYTLAKYLNLLSLTKIDSLHVHMVQFHLMEANFWMYNLKPLKAWSSIFRASTSVMTILESYKSSGRKFTESEHRILERVFHTCLKYESELRVELSPSIPSSGIVNYEFQTIYPTPPLDGSLSLNEELSWFFYLTEIVLRKLENRILDDLYVPESKSNENENDGEFLKDRYKLNWEKLTSEDLIGRVTEFVNDFKKIEVNIERHLKLILQDDQATSNEAIQRHGYVFKPIDTTNKTSTPSDHDISATSTEVETTPNQDESMEDEPSSNTTTPNSSDATVHLPEVLNFVQTRMITLKMLLFRPIAYFVMNVDPTVAQHPFIAQLLKQSDETMDLLNVQLAVHRHFGSWFYLRNAIMGCVLGFGLYKKVREAFCTKKKIETLCYNCLVIIDYWIDEAPYLLRSKEIVNEVLKEVLEEM